MKEEQDIKDLSDKICQEVAQDLLDSGVFEALSEEERKESNGRYPQDGRQGQTSPHCSQD